jgi:hypothetical protein
MSLKFGTCRAAALLNRVDGGFEEPNAEILEMFGSSRCLDWSFSAWRMPQQVSSRG